MLYGRHAECDALDRLLADARRSRSGVLVVRGEAGVGKSALLGHAAGRAEGMTVLRAAGVESEAELPFAALHQLLRPVLELAGRLPEHQAAALAGALRLQAAEERGEGDRFLVSVAVLSLLAEAAEARPVLGLVDEAQWLDRSSAEALGFAARRLEAEGVVLLFAARDGDPRQFPADGLPELRLGGLDPSRRPPCWRPRPGPTCPRPWSTGWSSGPAATPWPCWSCPGRSTRASWPAGRPWRTCCP